MQYLTELDKREEIIIVYVNCICKLAGAHRKKSESGRLIVTRKLSRVPSPWGEILAEDLEYKPTREDWNIYEVVDGTSLRVKLVMQKISRGLMDDEKTIRYTPDGVPVYSIRYTISVVPDVPEQLLKKK